MPATATAEGCIDVCWTTGATVRRYDFFQGREFDEVLSTDPAHVNLSQLNNRAPVLDSHQKDGSLSVKGVVTRAWLEGGKGYASLRFDLKDPEAAEIHRKAKEGFLRGVSVGYDVQHFREVPATPTTRAQLIAEAWTPLEISPCAIGADGEAGVLARTTTRTSTCTLTRAEVLPMTTTTEATPKQKRDMANMEKIVAAIKEYLMSAALKTDAEKELAAYKLYAIAQGNPPTPADPAAEDLGPEGGEMMAEDKAIAEAARKVTGHKERDLVIETLLSFSVRSDNVSVLSKGVKERKAKERISRLDRASKELLMTPAKAAQVKEWFRDGTIAEERQDAWLDRELGLATPQVDTREIEPPDAKTETPTTPKTWGADDYLKDPTFQKFSKSRGWDEKAAKEYATSYANISKGRAFEMPFEGVR